MGDCHESTKKGICLDNYRVDNTAFCTQLCNDRAEIQRETKDKTTD